MTPQAGLAAQIRLDKWLWQARLCRTRALAATLVAAGRVLINGQRTDKPGRHIGAGDVLTLVQGGQVRLLRVLAPGGRRGPAPEAALLYAEVEPPESGAGQEPLE